MSFSESAVVAAIVFVAALLQVTLFASLDVAGGVADVLLLALLSIALLRGAVVGSIAGFFGGLLVDVLTLDTLGVSALLYALAGYWAGRYGETTGRDRAYAPLLTVLVGHDRDRLRRLRASLPARRGALGTAGALRDAPADARAQPRRSRGRSSPSAGRRSAAPASPTASPR